MNQDKLQETKSLEIGADVSRVEPIEADSAQSYDTRGPDLPPVEKPSFTTKYFENIDKVGQRDYGKVEPIFRKEPLAKSFGRYRLESVLGKGGMGEVYLAYDSVLQRQVALKAPRLIEDSPAQRERFMREARSAAALHHPNICPLHDVGEFEGQLYLTMAYVEGESVSAALRRDGPLDADRAVRLIHKVALAMQHAHERGLLHRDLKPANILLTKKGEPVVTDFGLAFRFDLEADDRLTEKGLMVGTPSYMPPEQVNGHALGPTADVYSLGVVLYELLTGKTPFAGPLGKLIAQIEATSPDPPSVIRPSIEPDLEAICLKALAKQPGDRFPDMAAFAKALDDYAEAKRARFVAEQAAFAVRRQWRTRIAILTAAAVVLIAGSVTAAVLWVRNADRDIAPAPEMQLTDSERLMTALTKPLVKIDWQVTDAAPVHAARNSLPPSVLQFPDQTGVMRTHEGPLYFSISGSGNNHILDLTDQPGQAAQITHFSGEIDVKAPYLLFLGTVVSNSKFYIKGGIGYSILAPMDGGMGSKHVEFDGTHLLMPKITMPTIERTDATGAERAGLRNQDLIRKTVWKYERTEYTIFARPGTKVVPGNHEIRKAQFPEVYEIIEADRRRQNDARTVSNARLQAALQEMGKRD